MKRPKKSTSLVTPAVVAADQLCKVIGGYAQSATSATPSRPEIAVIIIAAVA